ncbi:MAG TPA: RsmE family RNA methyltransferase [Saprospiraceae bacterium]|nr:RsmE family RNA methyltransferase [Saprospiraceae bacterium]
MGVNSLQWYYLADLKQTGEMVSLSGDEWHHCYHVLRLTTGDDIILTDGKGQCMQGKIISASKQEGVIQLIHDLTTEYQNPRTYKLSIGIAPTKNIDRTEFAIEKLVELGVDEICFLDCKHAERTHLRMDRIEKIILSAAKQSRKIFIPRLLGLTSPMKYVNQKQTEQSNTSVLCCHMDPASKSVGENYLTGQDVVMLIGPEGGFAHEEIEDLMGLGAKLVHLGPFRLRVETAAITACADIHLINELKSKT